MSKLLNYLETIVFISIQITINFFSLCDLVAKYTLSSNAIGYHRTLATLNLPGTWSYHFLTGVPR